MDERSYISTETAAERSETPSSRGSSARPSRQASSARPPRKHVQHMTTTADELLTTIGRKLEAPENLADEFDAVGKSVACKLRRVSETSTRTRVFAEKIINDVLYYAELGYINENSHFALNRPAEAQSNSSITYSNLGQDISYGQAQVQNGKSSGGSYNEQTATDPNTMTASTYIQNFLSHNSNCDQWE